MSKTLRMMLCGILLVAAFCTMSAFTSATPAAHAEATTHSTTTAAVSPSYSCPLPVIQSGKTNPAWAVKLLQQSLNWWYNHNTYFHDYAYQYHRGLFPISEDGQFGAKTETAVAVFQDWDHKVTGSPDGIVGAKTWHALGHC